MPKEILTRCGYRCDLCLAYKDNIATEDQREFLSDTWHKIYGFRIPAEEIYCEGCLSPGNPRLIDGQCPVRPCVMERSLENCSQCDDYPCETFKQRRVRGEDFTKDKKISRKEYSRCIKPYENEKRLAEIRQHQAPHSRLRNPFIIPDRESMLRFIETEPANKLWTDLQSFIDATGRFDKAQLFGGKNYGWAIQYKKSRKTIVTLFPERKSFSVLLTFGKKELESIRARQELFSPGVLALIENTRQYHDGKWVWLRLEAETLYADVKKLIQIKGRF